MKIKFKGLEGPPWTARTYYDKVAKPLAERYKKEPMACDLALGACVAVWHTIDWLAEEADGGLSAVRDKLRPNFADFDYLHAAAIIAKHRTIDRSPSHLAGVENILTHPFGIKIGFGPEASHLIQPVLIRFKDGASRNCLQLVEQGCSALEETFALR